MKSTPIHRIASQGRRNRPLPLGRRGAPIALLFGLLLVSVPAPAAEYALGTTSLLESPASGTDTVVLAVTPATGSWTATANDPWLHLGGDNRSGTGGTDVLFAFDANPGPTRTGTVTIAGLTVVVTQSGARYVPAKPITIVENGYGEPIAVDRAGNVYFGGIFGEDQPGIRKWSATTGAVTTIVPGVTYYGGLAADGAGNV